MGHAFAWWLVLELVGIIALPLVFAVFRRLPDAGYAFAKPLGLLLGGYVFWLAMFFGVLPNRPGGVFWAFFLVAAISAAIAYRRRDELLASLRQRRDLIIAVEVVFTVVFFTAAHLRSFIPEIAGTEKPMDLMLLNTSARSESYPPADPWLAGFDVSYYYFGYVIQALVAKLAAAEAAIAFNLGLASTAALAATAAFGLGYNLVRLSSRATMRAGLLAGGAAAVFLVVLGNLEAVFEFAVANGIRSDAMIRWLDVANVEQAKESTACLPTLIGCINFPNEQSSFWWWWRATRISPDGNSITEFPFFSFLLGDLHPHVMAIPYVLTGVALGVALWLREEALDFRFWQRQPWLLLMAGVFVGGFGFLNAWDLPTFGFLIVVFVFARNLRSALDDAAVDERPAALLGRTAILTADFVLPLAAVAAAAYLPFYLNISTQESGFAAVSGGTKPLHAILFWAPLMAVVLPLPLLRITQDAGARETRRITIAAALPALLILLWSALLIVNEGGSAAMDAIGDRGANWLTVLFFAAALAAVLLALWRALEVPVAGEPALVPVLAATATALLLVLGSELFYVRDVFSSRLNTVFKLSYQAWLLLAVSGAYSAYWFLTRWQPEKGTTAATVRGAWSGVAGLVLLGALLYPLGATLSRTEGLGRPGRTLDGLAYTLKEAPNDFAAMDWLRDNADPGERIVEATGGQYTVSGRVAVRTGIPTVVGWRGHEVQWGRNGGLLGQRETDVDRAYTTEALAEALTILQKYDVTYVFVGTVERSKYPAPGLQKFEALPRAFASADTVIYRVPLGSAIPGSSSP